MDHPPAIRWHLRTLFMAATPITRALRSCVVMILSTPVANAVVGAVTARFVVVGVKTEDESAPIGIPMATPGERAIVVTSGYDDASRAVVLPFAGAGRSPRFAVKVASSRKTTMGTLREHERCRSTRHGRYRDRSGSTPWPSERRACRRARRVRA
jgi:hypothetical protein